MPVDIIDIYTLIRSIFRKKRKKNVDFGGSVLDVNSLYLIHEFITNKTIESCKYLVRLLPYLAICQGVPVSLQVEAAVHT